MSCWWMDEEPWPGPVDEGPEIIFTATSFNFFDPHPEKFDSLAKSRYALGPVINSPTPYIKGVTLT